MSFPPTYASYVDSGTWEKFHLSWRGPNLEGYYCIYYIT